MASLKEEIDFSENTVDDLNHIIEEPTSITGDSGSASEASVRAHCVKSLVILICMR